MVRTYIIQTAQEQQPESWCMCVCVFILCVCMFFVGNSSFALLTIQSNFTSKHTERLQPTKAPQQNCCSNSLCGSHTHTHTHCYGRPPASKVQNAVYTHCCVCCWDLILTRNMRQLQKTKQKHIRLFCRVCRKAEL